MPNSELQLFQFNTSPVRTVMKDGEPWFVVKDVCDVLDIADSNNSTLRGLEDSEKGMYTMHTLGGDQSMTIISESGMYALVLRSRKSQAKPFRLWVTNEVLPSIRKTGTYGTPALPEGTAVSYADAIIAYANALKEIEEQHANLLSHPKPVLSMCLR
jgi:prophage antirepressor-like protein